MAIFFSRQKSVLNEKKRSNFMSASKFRSGLRVLGRFALTIVVECLEITSGTLACSRHVMQ